MSTTPKPEHAEPTSPHDAIFKAVFSDLECLTALLRAALPGEIVEHADWSRAQIVSGTSVDGTLSERRSDLEVRVPVRGTTSEFVALAEHQSTPPWSMALRALGYQVRRWETWERERPRGARLRPPIAAVVLSHGRRWRRPQRFEETVDLQGPLASLPPFVPHLSYVVIDVSILSDTAIDALRLPPAAHAVFHLFRDGRRRPIPDVLVGLTKSFVSLLAARRDAVVVQLLRYAAALTRPGSAKPFRAALRKIHEAAGGGPMRSLDDVLYEQALTRGIEKGIEAGIEKGIEAGIEKGIEKERRDSLRWLLVSRFGPLSESLLARIERASSAQLVAWRERALTAASLADALED